MRWQYRNIGVFDSPRELLEKGQADDEIVRYQKPRLEKIGRVLGLMVKLELEQRQIRARAYRQIMYSVNEPGRWEDDGGPSQDFNNDEDLWAYTLKP